MNNWKQVMQVSQNMLSLITQVLLFSWVAYFYHHERLARYTIDDEAQQGDQGLIQACLADRQAPLCPALVGFRPDTPHLWVVGGVS